MRTLSDDRGPPRSRSRSKPSAAAATAAATPAAALAGEDDLPGARDIDRQGATLKIFVMKHFHCFVGFLGGGKFNEGKTAGFAGELVEHQID